MSDYYCGCLRRLFNGRVYGNSTGSTNLSANWDRWDRTTIVAGTKIGIMLDFNQDGTATLTGYKDGVRVGVLSTGSLRGPLCPAVWFNETGSVELISSNLPRS